jgi:hypothetical protein
MRKPIFSIFIALFYGLIFVVSIQSCKHYLPHPLMAVDTTSNGDGNNNGGTDTTHLAPKHPCSPDSVYFVNDILPLITSNCSMSGCHDGSGHSDDAKALTSYSTIMAYVRAYKPSSSKLYTSLFGGGEDRMPRSPIPPLSNAQDSMIFKWINQGALNNQCDGACDTSNITFSGSILPIIKTNCTGCHSGSSPNGNTLLTNYSDVLVQANNGKLIGGITYSQGFKAMPVANKLSDCDVNAITIWVRKGAPNN